jgi:hypothetical protein
MHKPLLPFTTAFLPAAWRLTLAVLLCLGAFGWATAQTPVEKFGALRVSGNKILDKNNQPVSLAGPSLFWSNAGWGGERFYTSGAVSYVKTDWNATIVRAAMGVEDGGGYLQDQAREKQKVRTVVDAAIAAGMYVIIDWHSHHAEDYRSQAVAFFTEMAQLYGTKPNVIFEIYNEPLQISWSSTIKPYAEAVIGAIRGTGSTNLVVVGTPTWSQRVDEAANDPITKYTNVAYTLHFYAATHKQSLRDIATTALNKNIALFVTEWGTVDASGGGSVDQTSTNEWMNFLKQHQISHLNWALNDKAEAASALKPGVSATGRLDCLGLHRLGHAGAQHRAGLGRHHHQPHQYAPRGLCNGHAHERRRSPGRAVQRFRLHRRQRRRPDLFLDVRQRRHRHRRHPFVHLHRGRQLRGYRHGKRRQGRFEPGQRNDHRNLVHVGRHHLQVRHAASHAAAHRAPVVQVRPRDRHGRPEPEQPH